MKYQELLAKNIKELRLKHNLTQEVFAEKIGLTTNGVSNIERNRYQPTAETIDRICRAFKITPAELLLVPTDSNKEIIENIVTLLGQYGFEIVSETLYTPLVLFVDKVQFASCSVNPPTPIVVALASR